MARPKKKQEVTKNEPFKLEDALAEVNPLLREGFHWFIIDKKITNQKDFERELKIYGGFQ